MKRLEFQGDITLEDIYEQNKDIIYTQILESISEVVDNKKELDRIEVMEFDKNGTLFTIDLKTYQFIPVLQSAIEYYADPSVEKYELCKKCKDLIDILSS
jgi:hypothetical protein